MNNEFFEALFLFEKERGIPHEYLIEKIKTAISIAIKKDYGISENVEIIMDTKDRSFDVFVLKTVVQEVENPTIEISPEEALQHDKFANVGDTVKISLETRQLGRIAAQAAKSVIKQSIRDAERLQLLEQYNSKLHKIVQGVVQRIEPNGNILIECDKSDLTLFKNEQIPNETFSIGDSIKVYVYDVVSNERRCNLKISRSNKDFVRKLFELEVPEIAEGTVKIMSIARDPGSRTKIAVYSENENVDAVGSCIGNKGIRISAVVDEINGEKIDVVKYSDNPEKFIAEALSPSSVISVEVISDEDKLSKVFVPHNQLSLAIGNRGQNAKLAAKLTGYKIDIVSDEQE